MAGCDGYYRRMRLLRAGGPFAFYAFACVRSFVPLLCTRQKAYLAARRGCNSNFPRGPAGLSRSRACMYIYAGERERERWRAAKKTAAGCCRRLLHSHTRMCAREWKESNTAGIMPFDAFSPDRARAPSLALVTRRLVVIFN